MGNAILSFSFARVTEVRHISLMFYGLISKECLSFPRFPSEIPPKKFIIIIFVGHWCHRDIWKWLYYCYPLKVKQFISPKHRNEYHCLLLINDIQSYGLNFVGEFVKSPHTLHEVQEFQTVFEVEMPLIFTDFQQCT